MSQIRQPLPIAPRSFGETLRKDVWWLFPLLTFLGFGHVRGLFDVGGVSGGALSVWAVLIAVLFAGGFWRAGAQLVRTQAALVAGIYAVVAGVADPLGAGRVSLHLLLLSRGVLQSVLGRSDLPAPSASRGNPIWGENSLPLILQNIHRYFLYLALHFHFSAGLRCLAGDVVCRCRQRQDASSASASGTIVLAVNVCLLASYTFGCHSLRHLIGGWRDEISKSPLCHKAYDCVSCLNRRHMSGRGAACSRSGLPISMFACAAWASGMTGESCNAGICHSSNMTCW